MALIIFEAAGRDASLVRLPHPGVRVALKGAASDGHQVVVFNNQLCLIGGRDSNFNRKNDVWSSSDGIVWTRRTASAAFVPAEVCDLVEALLEPDPRAPGAVWAAGSTRTPGSSALAHSGDFGATCSSRRSLLIAFTSRNTAKASAFHAHSHLSHASTGMSA